MHTEGRQAEDTERRQTPITQRMPKMAGKTIRRKRGLAQKEPTLPTPGFA
jgi:hypothetical protein